MSKVKVTVTAEDITQGTRFDVYTCPIALAFKRAFPKVHSSYVGIDAAFVEATENTKENANHYPLSTEAIDFVYDFDHGKDVKPFSFEIEEATS